MKLIGIFAVLATLFAAIASPSALFEEASERPSTVVPDQVIENADEGGAQTADVIPDVIASPTMVADDDGDDDKDAIVSKDPSKDEKDRDDGKTDKPDERDGEGDDRDNENEEEDEDEDDKDDED